MYLHARFHGKIQPQCQPRWRFFRWTARRRPCKAEDMRSTFATQLLSTSPQECSEKKGGRCKDGISTVHQNDCSQKRKLRTSIMRSFFLLAVTLQMAVWFIWNGSLYVVSLIYRLNRSKVYMWSDFCKCGDEGVKWDDCSEKRKVRTSIMRIFSFGCNSTNGSMVYVE